MFVQPKDILIKVSFAILIPTTMAIVDEVLNKELKVSHIIGVMWPV